MSRFVRLSEGHYINLDLVTDIIVSGPNEDDEWDLTLYYAVPHSEEGQIELALDYKTEAEAMSVLARILPESTHPEGSTGTAGHCIDKLKPLSEVDKSSPL